MKLKAIGGIIAVVILLILCSVVWQNWQTMRVQDFEIHYGFLALSFAAFLLVFFMAAYGWGLGLQALGVEIGLRRMMRLWFFSQFTRWLPGNLWSVLSIYCLSQGLPRATVVLSGILNLVFNMAGALLAVAAFFYWWPTGIMQGYWLLCVTPAVLAIGAILWRPTLLSLVYANPLARFVAAKAGKASQIEQMSSVSMSRMATLGLLVYFLIYWCISGLAFYLFVRSISPAAVPALPACILIYALSWVISFLAFVTPSGLGVKESVTAAMLAYYLPVGVAVLVALALRILMIAVEILCLAIVALWGDRQGMVFPPESLSEPESDAPAGKSTV